MILDENRAERVVYSYPEYDAYIQYFRCDRPMLHHKGTAHWHNDVEFLVTVAGTSEHNVNGEILTLHSGETIFVNSRQMHYARPSGSERSEVLCIRLNPNMLCMSPFFDSSYVLPVTQNRNMPYLILREDSPWQRSVIFALNEMYRQSKSPTAHLKIHALFCFLWAQICENMPESAPSDPASANDLTAIEAIVEYIEHHYAEKLTLADLAEAGHICQSKCCRLFGKYLHKTPNTYLTHYRLGKAAELLLQTDQSVTEIAFACGFSGASYFAETFRKTFDLSPKEYRIKNRL